MTTIPRAEFDTIAQRYNDSFHPSGEPTAEYARECAAYYRSAVALLCDARSRETLIAEADDLDALADRYEKEVPA